MNLLEINKKTILIICFNLVFLNLSSQKKDEKWTNLFNGKDLKGWNIIGGNATFQIDGDMIVGTAVSNTPNTFLCTEKLFGDFILELEVMADTTLNSGIQFRSNSFEGYQNYRVHGYQAEIDPTKRALSGGIYDEARRGWLTKPDKKPQLQKTFKKGKWNKYRILAIKDSLKVWINDIKISDITDDRTTCGFIGLQVHSVDKEGKNGKEGDKVRFKNIRIQVFDNEEPDADLVNLFENYEQNKIDILIDGIYFTSYIFPKKSEKPVLYPVLTSNGKFVTRGFPISPRSGERVDHPHHLGIWFNYGDVNGLDFWNNSYVIPQEKKIQYGFIRHKEIRKVANGKKEGSIETVSEWCNSDSFPLLKEETRLIFSGFGYTRYIDRVSKLTALKKDVLFKDNKEGLYAIRVDRAFEMPSTQPEVFTDASGNPTQVPVLNNDGVTGNYRSSEGIIGEKVWGTRAKWVRLDAVKDSIPMTITIIDHPNNPGYPTYWHARGYGLFSANNLGQKIFSEGKQELNYKIPAGKSATFKYRILIQSTIKLTDIQINNEMDNFVNSR